MARYYKYAPQQYESMFVPLPLDLFAAKLQGEQGKFDALEQSSQQVQDQWRSLQVDPYDVEKLDKKIAEMKQEFSDVIDNSKGDVNRMYSELNRLNRDWNEYTTMGQGAAMTQSLATVQEARKKYDEAVAKGDKKEASRWVEFLNNYRQWGESGGTKPSEGGRYTTFGYDFGSPDFDADKWHKEIALPGWNANKESYKLDIGDYATAESMETLDADRVYNGLYGDLSTREDFEKTTNNKFRYYTKDLDARGMINVALNGYDGNSGLIALRDGYIKKADELEKAGKKDEAAKYKAQAEYFSGRVNAITNAASFEDAVGAATNEAYKVFKEAEIQNTMALAMAKLPYVKQSWSELTRTPKSDMLVAKYAYDLQNKANPIVTVNTGSNSDAEVINTFGEMLTSAQGNKNTAFSNIIQTGLDMVVNKDMTAGDFKSLYNSALAKLQQTNKNVTTEEVVIAMAEEGVQADNVDEYNKAHGTNMTPEAFSRWQNNAIGDVIEYQVNDSKINSLNSFVTTKANDMIDDNFIMGVEIAMKFGSMETRSTILQMLGEHSPTGLDWDEMNTDQKKEALKTVAANKPEEFLTFYANTGGNLDDMVKVMYGSTVTSTAGPIKELNDQLTLAFTKLSPEELQKSGALEGVGEMFKPEGGGKLDAVTFTANSLGFGVGFAQFTFKDKDGNTYNKVLDISKNSDAYNISMGYFAEQVSRWKNNPANSSKETIQRETDKSLELYGSLILGNTLSPITGEQGITQYAKDIKGNNYEIVPIKYGKKIEYQAFEIGEGGVRTPVLNSNDNNTYQSIGAFNREIGNQFWEKDNTGRLPSDTKKGYTRPTDEFGE